MPDKDKTKTSNGWTAERRAKQSARCHANKPWEKSTGPRTKTGKAKSSMNACKNKGHSQYHKECKKVIKLNRAFLRQVKLTQRLMAEDFLKKNELIELDVKTMMYPPSTPFGAIKLKKKLDKIRHDEKRQILIQKNKPPIPRITALLTQLKGQDSI